jgi:hypothetical protein
MTVQIEERAQTKEASGRKETGAPQHSGMKIAAVRLQSIVNEVVAKIVVEQGVLDWGNAAKKRFTKSLIWCVAWHFLA